MFSGVRNPDLACFFGVNVFAENGAGVNKLQISRLIRSSGIRKFWEKWSAANKYILGVVQIDFKICTNKSGREFRDQEILGKVIWIIQTFIKHPPSFN